jgi:DNA-binding PadR family transcriptional regulator
MSLRYALLALLAEGESHGYRLVKELGARLGPCWHPNVGQVYQLLHELERRGWIVHRLEAGGVRSRRLFHLTARGERALRAWLGRRPGWPPPMRDEIFVRVLAAERLGAPAILAQVERHEQEYRRYLALLEEQGGRFGSMARELAHEAALAHAHAHLLWLTRCREVVSRPVVSAAS